MPVVTDAVSLNLVIPAAAVPASCRRGLGCSRRRGRGQALRTVRLRTMADLETEKMFRGPRSVRVDEDGLMWVPDFESYRLQVYRKEAFQLEPHQLAPPLKAPSLQPN